MEKDPLKEEIKTTLEERDYHIVEYMVSTPLTYIIKVFSNKYNSNFVAKVLNIDSPSFSSNIQSFTSEVKSLSKVYHSHVINIYQHFTDDRHLYIILEYCPGGSTMDYLKNGAIDDTLLIQWLRQCVNALACCHANGISHGDIKPSNILIDNSNRVKLADFGLSYFGERRKNLMRITGTIPFCAPEMIKRVKYDPYKADVWSLGMTFYVLKFNDIPYKGKNETELMNQIINTEVVIPDSSFSELTNILKSMLVRDPSKRISSVELAQMPLFDNQNKGIPLLPRLRARNEFFSAQNIPKKNPNFRNKQPYRTKNVRSSMKPFIKTPGILTR